MYECSGEGHPSFSHTSQPLNGEVRDLHTDGGSEVAGITRLALSPLDPSVFTPSRCLLFCRGSRRREEKETVGGISVKLGR